MRERAARLSKRSLDLALAVPALVLLAPVLVLIAILVRCNMGRPVLFRQRRTGLNCSPFNLMKFRTMTCACDRSGRLLTDSQRLTAVGRFLRSTSLDELPELIHVLRGEMSLVGPRPLVTEYLGRYSPYELRRHQVLPGITGWAQVHGRNAISWEQRFALDVWYVEHQSLWLDLRILAMTAWCVLSRRGISQNGHATMPELRSAQA